MRNLKRLVAMILVVLSLLAMAVPTAMAEDPEKIVFAYMTQNNIPQEADRLRIQNLIKLIIMFLVDLWFTKWPILILVEDFLKN